MSQVWSGSVTAPMKFTDSPSRKVLPSLGPTRTTVGAPTDELPCSTEMLTEAFADSPAVSAPVSVMTCCPPESALVVR